MDTAQAILMGALNRHRERKVFDWCKAAKIIKSNNPDEVWAGLKGDFENTSGLIYSEGKIIDSYQIGMYLASTWATPVIQLLINDEEYEFPCYIMESETTWNEHTVWPDEAKDIIGG